MVFKLFSPFLLRNILTPFLTLSNSYNSTCIQRIVFVFRSILWSSRITGPKSTYWTPGRQFPGYATDCGCCGRWQLLSNVSHEHFASLRISRAVVKETRRMTAMAAVCVPSGANNSSVSASRWPWVRLSSASRSPILSSLRLFVSFAS